MGVRDHPHTLPPSREENRADPRPLCKSQAGDWRAGGAGRRRQGIIAGGETMPPWSWFGGWCGCVLQRRARVGAPPFLHGARGVPFLSGTADRGGRYPLFFLSPPLPLPPPGSTTPLNAEMEFDSYQHYFYDHDAQEDFHRSTAPSEDIWKKFELVPTPPLSPLGPLGEKACWSGAEERSGCLSRYCLSGDEPEYLIGTGEIFGNLSAFILKDCMWSGFSARERLEKAMTEKLSTGTQRATPHKPSFAQDFGFGSSVSECVDPAAVFLCPLAESKIPASSGSEGQSDSGKGPRCGLPPAQPCCHPRGARRGGHARPRTCACREPPSRAAPLLQLQASPGAGPANKAGSAAPLPAGLLLGKPLPLAEGCVELPVRCVGLWWPLSLVPPHGTLVGRLARDKFAARRGNFGVFGRCSVLCCRLVTSAASPGPHAHGTHLGRVFLGRKGKIAPGAGRLQCSGRPP